LYRGASGAPFASTALLNMSNFRWTVSGVKPNLLDTITTTNAPTAFDLVQERDAMAARAQWF
jgi:hypothetical protein